MQKEKYAELVKKLETGHVYTHGGKMDVNDVCSGALLNMIADKEGIERPEIHRLSDMDDLKAREEEGNLIFNVKEYEEASSMAKIYEAAGEELFGEKSAEMIKERFIDPIEKYDRDTDEYRFAEMMENLNPTWIETVKPDEAYNDAVRIAEQGINERFEEVEYPRMGEQRDLTDFISSMEEDIYETRGEEKLAAVNKASELIQSAISSAQTFSVGDNDYAYMDFERGGIPYEQIKEEVEEYNKDNEPEIIGYTFPSRSGITFKPVTDEFTPLERWRGAEEFDIEGMSFCHKEGYSMTFDDMDSCINAINTMVGETLGIEVEAEAENEVEADEAIEDEAEIG